MKENIDRPMLFVQVGNDIKEDTFIFLQHEGMEHSEDKINYVTLIAYTFKQYSLKREME